MRSSARRLLPLVALALVLGQPTLAFSDPLPGLWEARGPGGARVTFVVVAAGHERIAADPVVFCGPAGEPAWDWGQVWRRWQTEVKPSGRIVDISSPTILAGRLATRSGSVTSSVEQAPSRTSCSPQSFERMRARHVGPVKLRDGLWSFAGTLGSSGPMEVYGGGTLVTLAGTFVGPPSPQAPEVGPCLPTLPASFGSRWALAVSRGGAFGGPLESGMFGYASRVSLAGGFGGPTRGAAVYVGGLTYPGYVCGASGFIVAQLRRPAPPYEKIYHPRSQTNSPQPRLPGLPRVRAPRSGKEPNSFRCDVRRPDGAYDFCRAYPRTEGETTRWVVLRHGDKAWGLRHIERRRGFSAKTDSYIARTVARGEWDPAAKRFERAYRGRGRKCRYRVVDEGDPKGIITAYVVEPGKQGPVSRCP